MKTLTFDEVLDMMRERLKHFDGRSVEHIFNTEVAGPNEAVEYVGDSMFRLVEFPPVSAE